MRRITVVAALLWVCCAHAGLSTNAIDGLAERLNASNGLWMNGLSPVIAVSSNGLPAEVVASAVKMIGFAGGRIREYEILEVRKIPLKHQPECFAALIDSDLGRKILLFKFVRGGGGSWWTKFIDLTDEVDQGAPGNAGSRPRP